MQMQRHRVGAVEPQLFGCKGEDTAATMVQHGGRRHLSFVALRGAENNSLSQIWKNLKDNSTKGTLHYFHRCLMCTEFESRETFTHFYSLHPIAWQSPVILVFAFQSPVVNPTKSAVSVPASAATTTSHCFSW